MTTDTAAPQVDTQVIYDLAVAERVCVRPVLRRVTDRFTGETSTIPMPCQSTQESRCPSCAAKARFLRMTQCSEGWHLAEEPAVRLDATDVDADDDNEVEEPDEGQGERQVRSTRRRSEVPDLPRIPQEKRTVGRVFTAQDGSTYRPSMFTTVTLPSYGRILPGRGIPVDPSRYDYRRAALDALHFPRLLDRWFQNLRRCAGYKVQYFGAIEPQRRLAPHFHVAMRGAIPRATIKAVTKATYVQFWWPQMHTPIYVKVLPVWDGRDYLNPDTLVPLPTWDQALEQLAEADAEPAHFMRFGSQLDIRGLLGGTPDADRSVRYLCKYLTKSVSETYSDPDDLDVAYEAHIDRLHAHTRWLPCSPECANWLRFGIQPKDAGPGLTPGACPAKAHNREHVGLGGRRCLVSRGWSGKTLSEHKADRAAVVRAMLEAAGITPPEAQRMSAEVLADDGKPRFVWDAITLGPEATSLVVMASVRERRRWRTEFDRAKELVSGTSPPVDSRSATDQPPATIAAEERSRS